jgi:hypothetical protein
MKRPATSADRRRLLALLRLGSMIWLLPRAYVPNRIAEHSGLIVLSLNGLSLTDISAGAEPRCIMLAVERVSMFSMRDTHDRRPELAHGI